MTTETLHIRNMVCPRCIEAVVNILKEQNLNAIEVQLGQAIIAAPLDNKGAIAAALKQRGFELIQDKKERLIIGLVLEDLSYKEIASIIGATTNLVGVKINRIKKKLKTLMNS